MSSDEEEAFLNSLAAKAGHRPAAAPIRSAAVNSGWAVSGSHKAAMVELSHGDSSTVLVPSGGSSTALVPSGGSTLTAKPPRPWQYLDSASESEDDGKPEGFAVWPRQQKLCWLAHNANTPPTASAWVGAKVMPAGAGIADRSSRLSLLPPPRLTDAQQSALDALKAPWQRHLQRLVYALSRTGEFTLLSHQFDSALLCAGIRGPWPTEDLTTPELMTLFASPYDRADAAQVEARRATLAPYLPFPAEGEEGVPPGCLLGDVMGLGKTVSASVGLVLREFVDALRGGPRRSTLIVVPNSLLEEVWCKHLRQMGVHASQILRYTGDFLAKTRKDSSKGLLRGKDYPRVVLATKYTLAGDLKGAIEHSGLPSPLMPQATAATLGTFDQMYDAMQQGGSKADKKEKAAGAGSSSNGGGNDGGGMVGGRGGVGAAAGSSKRRKSRSVNTDPGAPARIAAKEAQGYDKEKLPWLTVVIDECHDMRSARGAGFEGRSASSAAELPRLLTHACSLTHTHVLPHTHTLAPSHTPLRPYLTHPASRSHE